MAKTDKADMSCARVKQYTASDVSKAERHNERKNETYENMNVIVERIPFNRKLPFILLSTILPSSVFTLYQLPVFLITSPRIHLMLLYNNPL